MTFLEDNEVMTSPKVVLGSDETTVYQSQEGYNPKRGYFKVPGAIRSLKELQEKGVVGLEELVELEAKDKLPFSVLLNDYYLSLMDVKNPDDPVRKIVIPSAEEILKYGGDFGDINSKLDTSNEKGNTLAPGLQHKYDPTAVLVTSILCAALCRYCFRKRLWMAGHTLDNYSGDGDIFPNEDAVEYLINSKGSTKEPNTVLLTGGDVFMRDNAYVKHIMDVLADPRLDHIQNIRFGSRMTSFYPERFDNELIDILGNYTKETGKQLRFSTHFSHPNEFSEKSADAVKKLDTTGEVYNQTVLLKGINDDADVLYKLFEEKLARNGVRPYYLFQDRPVLGSEHFQVDLKDGVELVSQLYQNLTGTNKPRYSMSTPYGKMLISAHPDDENKVVLTFHSANPKELTGKSLSYEPDKYTPGWIDTDWLAQTVNEKYNVQLNH